MRAVPKIVDKEERMQMILSKALEVFAKVGYRESNLSLIAEACCLSRPTVYQYFSDKKEIYYYAVKNVTSRMPEKTSPPFPILWSSSFLRRRVEWMYILQSEAGPPRCGSLLSAWCCKESIETLSANAMQIKLERRSSPWWWLKPSR